MNRRQWVLLLAGVVCISLLTLWLGWDWFDRALGPKSRFQPAEDPDVNRMKQIEREIERERAKLEDIGKRLQGLEKRHGPTQTSGSTGATIRRSTGTTDK